VVPLSVMIALFGNSIPYGSFHIGRCCAAGTMRPGVVGRWLLFPEYVLSRGDIPLAHGVVEPIR
jgi:hypothetical protein